MSPADIEIAKALRLIDQAGAELSKSPSAFSAQSQPLPRLPIVDETDAAARSELGKKLLAESEAIDRSALPRDLAISVQVAGRTAARWAKESDWYWHVYDPAGVGFFAMFGPTSYGGGFALSQAVQLLGRERFTRSGDFHRYLGLVADVAATVASLQVRLEGQMARGMVMPRSQLAQAQAFMQALATQVPAMLAVDAARYGDLDGGPAFQRELQALVDGPVAAAFRSLQEFLGGDYAGRAGDAVGIGQYQGGAEIYAELVRLHTTLDLTPEQVHATGHARMREIREGMREIRSQAGFTGSDADYLKAIEANPAWRAADAAGVQAVFQRYIDRIAPHVEANFNLKPKAAHTAAALPEALAKSMTFGFYRPSQGPGLPGTYLYNAGNLVQAGLANIGSLNYHELVPGHHFHLATQYENELLAPVRKHSFFNAFNEGWAEYAATLAGEMGMYPAPEERFGRLMMDAFLTCRLVVDTGMNVLGWSLEQARDYMRENSFMSEREIATESIRYSCDIPGQALAYKLGDTFLLQQRARMQAALGADFSLRDFHDVVLAPGALPLPLVAQNIDHRIAAARAN